MVWLPGHLPYARELIRAEGLLVQAAVLGGKVWAEGDEDSETEGAAGAALAGADLAHQLGFTPVAEALELRFVDERRPRGMEIFEEVGGAPCLRSGEAGRCGADVNQV